MNTTKLLDRRPEEVVDDLLLGNAAALAEAATAAAEIETILEEGEHRACDWRVWDPDCPPAIPARTAHDETGITRLRALRARTVHLVQDRLAGCRLAIHRGRVVPTDPDHHEHDATPHPTRPPTRGWTAVPRRSRSSCSTGSRPSRGSTPAPSRPRSATCWS